MSKKIKQVEVVDDDLLKLLLEKISVLTQQVQALQSDVNQVKSRQSEHWGGRK